jgi:hypothetical protein
MLPVLTVVPLYLFTELSVNVFPQKPETGLLSAGPHKSPAWNRDTVYCLGTVNSIQNIADIEGNRAKTHELEHACN